MDSKQVHLTASSESKMVYSTSPTQDINLMLWLWSIGDLWQVWEKRAKRSVMQRLRKTPNLLDMKSRICWKSFVDIAVYPVTMSIWLASHSELMHQAMLLELPPDTTECHKSEGLRASIQPVRVLMNSTWTEMMRSLWTSFIPMLEVCFLESSDRRTVWGTLTFSRTVALSNQLVRDYHFRPRTWVVLTIWPQSTSKQVLHPTVNLLHTNVTNGHTLRVEHRRVVQVWTRREWVTTRSKAKQEEITIWKQPILILTVNKPLKLK